MHLFFTLLSNAHWIIEDGVPEQFVVVRRTPKKYAALTEVYTSFEAVRRVVDQLDRCSTSVLVDMRLAPLRDEPEFERALSEQPKYLSRDFKRSAVLIGTAIGLLQVQRHMRRLGLPMRVFNNELQALDYVRGWREPTAIRTATPGARRSL
jgi:hypothetical protein